MSESDGDIPVHLMPVAAFLGCLATFCIIRAAIVIHANLTYDPLSRKGTPPPFALDSNPFMLLVGIIVAALAGYGKIVATINTAYAEQQQHE